MKIRSLIASLATFLVVSFPHNLFAQLNADSLTANGASTIFMAPYTLWWYHAFGAPYALQGLNYTTIADYAGSNTTAGTESYYLYNGDDPSPPTNDISSMYVPAIPSLYASGLPGAASTIAYGSNSGPSTSGYDSNDDQAIIYHAKLLSNAGIQVLVADLSNNMDSMFGSSLSVQPTFSTVSQAAGSADDQVSGINSWYNQYCAPSGENGGSIQLRGFARLLTDLHSLSTTSGSPNLYVVPCVGGSADEQFDNSSGDSEFEKALTFALNALAAYPDRSVTYQSAPLILVYHGNASDIQYLISEANSQASVIAGRGYNFTLRHVTGLAGESGYGQWTSVRSASESTWNTSSPRYSTAPAVPSVRLQDSLWSWADQLYSNESGTADAFASYGVVPGTTTPEYFQASFNSGADVGDQNPYDVPYLSVRMGEQLDTFLSSALQLRPKFLFIHHFNQYINDDGGFTIDANNSFEPTVDSSNTVHTEDYNYLYYGISDYNAHMAGTAAARFSDIRFRGQINASGINQLILGFQLGNTGTGPTTPQRIYFEGIGPSLGRIMGYPSGDTFASNPIVAMANAGNNETFTNDGYENATIAETSGGASLIDSRNDRAFYNSPIYFQSLDFGQTLQTSETGMTLDLSPGTYTATVVDGDDSSPSVPGLMSHVRMIPGDLITNNHVTNFSMRGYVSATGDNQCDLAWTLDAQKTIMIIGAGPGLAPFLGSNGLLQTPEIKVFNSQGTVLASNSGISSSELSTFQSVVSWVTTADTGLIVTLPAGQNYSVILSNGSGQSTNNGVGLLTVYEY